MEPAPRPVVPEESHQIRNVLLVVGGILLLAVLGQAIYESEKADSLIRQAAKDLNRVNDVETSARELFDLQSQEVSGWEEAIDKQKVKVEKAIKLARAVENSFLEAGSVWNDDYQQEAASLFAAAAGEWEAGARTLSEWNTALLAATATCNLLTEGSSRYEETLGYEDRLTDLLNQRDLSRLREETRVTVDHIEAARALLAQVLESDQSLPLAETVIFLEQDRNAASYYTRLADQVGNSRRFNSLVSELEALESQVFADSETHMELLNDPVGWYLDTKGILGLEDKTIEHFEKAFEYKERAFSVLQMRNV